MLYPLSQSDNPGSIALIACTGMHGEKWSPLTDWHTQGSRQVPQVPARDALLVRNVVCYCTPFCIYAIHPLLYAMNTLGTAE
jgi:hypothetical protein